MSARPRYIGGVYRFSTESHGIGKHLQGCNDRFAALDGYINLIAVSHPKIQVSEGGTVMEASFP